MSINLGRALNILTYPVKTCRNIEDGLIDARALLNKKSAEGKGAGFFSIRGFFSGISINNHVSRYVYDILNFLENINWESVSTTGPDNVNPNHPMMPVLDMITVIKSKLDIIENERNEIENELIISKQLLEEKVHERTLKLQESELRAREILDNSPVSIAIMDSDYIVR